MRTEETTMQVTISFPEFLSMFESFNRDIWPLQALMLLCGAAIAIATIKQSRTSDRISAAVLGSIWIFVGAVFQWIYFRPIYEPARLFAALWIVQGVLFITIVPLFWALGGVVPLSWGVTEDVGLVVGGTAGIALLFVRDARKRNATLTA